MAARKPGKAKPTPEETERDPARPAADYLRLVARDQKAVAAGEARGVGYALLSLPYTCLRIAMALYSAGRPVGEVRRWLRKAVTLKLRFLRLNRHRFDGFPSGPADFELYGASLLVGQGERLAAGLRKVQYDEPLPPAIQHLVDAFLAFLAGEAVRVPPAAVAAVRSEFPGRDRTLPLLAAARPSSPAFAPALAEYLTDYWSRIAANMAGKGTSPPDYSGVWSFVAAGCCARAGGVPPLPTALALYVPVDLIPG